MTAGAVAEQRTRPGLKQRIGQTFVARVIKRYLDFQGPNWATLIAWNGLFAFFPIVLVTVTLLGLVLRSDTMVQDLKNTVVQAFPGSQQQQDTILAALQGVRHNSGALAIVGFLGLLWGGSALFSSMEQALSALYGCKQRDFIQQKLMSFGMILVFTVLAVPLVLSSALLPTLKSLNAPSFLTSGPSVWVIQIVAGILVGTLIFLAIYYVVPNRKQHFRRVLIGAVVSGVLLEALTFLFPLYVKLAGGFNTYGATFALFFLLLTYAYFLGQITVIGGTVNAEYELSHSGGVFEGTPATLEEEMRPGTEPQPTTTLPGKAQRERAAHERVR